MHLEAGTPFCTFSLNTSEFNHIFGKFERSPQAFDVFSLAYLRNIVVQYSELQRGGPVDL